MYFFLYLNVFLDTIILLGAYDFGLAGPFLTLATNVCFHKLEVSLVDVPRIRALKFGVCI